MKSKHKNNKEIIWYTYFLEKGQIIKIDGFPLEIQEQTIVRTATPMSFLKRKDVFI